MHLLFTEYQGHQKEESSILMLVTYQKQRQNNILADVMNKYRNKLVYNADTGEIKDDRRHMSMLEDFWLPEERVVEEQRLQLFQVDRILQR